MLKIRPQDAEAPMTLARIHHTMGEPDKGIEVLEQFIRNHTLATPLNLFNILAELYMESEQYEKARSLIVRIDDQICKEGLPIDLQVLPTLHLASAVQVAVQLAVCTNSLQIYRNVRAGTKAERCN